MLPAFAAIGEGIFLSDREPAGWEVEGDALGTMIGFGAEIEETEWKERTHHGMNGLGYGFTDLAFTQRSGRFSSSQNFFDFGISPGWKQFSRSDVDFSDPFRLTMGEFSRSESFFSKSNLFEQLLKVLRFHTQYLWEEGCAGFLCRFCLGYFFVGNVLICRMWEIGDL